MASSTSTSAGSRRVSAPVSTLRGIYAVVAALLAAGALWLPHGAVASWTALGVLASLTALAGVWMHPLRYRPPLWWVAGALACMLATQVCAFAGAWPGSPAGAATYADVFGVATCVAVGGALVGCMSRRIPDWDMGFLIDVVIVVASAAATGWLFFVAPRILSRSGSVFFRLTLTAYPTADLVLLVLIVMALTRAGARRRGVVLAACGVAGLVFSNSLLLVAHLGQPPTGAYWRQVTWADAGWLVFQLTWGAALLHAPSPQCVAAPRRGPHRPMTLLRLMLLLIVALADPVVFDIQSARGRLAPVGRFPLVSGMIFVAVIVRLVFVAVEHLRSVRRLNILLDAQTRVAGAQSVAELARITARAAAGLLGGPGETTAVLRTADKLVSATCRAPSGLPADAARSAGPSPGAPPGDRDRDEDGDGDKDGDTDRDGDGPVAPQWRGMLADWPPPEAGPGPRLWFLEPDRLPHSGGARPAGALICPVHESSPPREARPSGLLAISGGTGRVAAAADALAVLAGQAGQGVERIGMAGTLARRHLSAMTANIADAILIVDEQEAVRYANDAAGILFGSPLRPGAALSDLVGREHAEALTATADGAARRWTLPGGSQVVEAVVDDRRTDPTVGGFVLTLRDVTRLNVLEHQLRRRATHDAETGLENRLAFTRRLAAVDADDRVRHAVLAVSVDHLAEMTEQFGTEHGARLMEETARRLVFAFGPGQASVARLDGSTLALLVRGRPELPPAAVFRAQVRAVLSALVALDGRTVAATASAGLGVDGGGRSTTDLLDDALLALHAAQRQGPRGFATYTPALRAISREQAEMRAGLNEALRDGGLTLHYQPVVDLADRMPVAVEALVRWPRPDGTFISPEVFVPLAERTGQITSLGGWVLRRALEDYLGWQPAATVPGGRRLRVNVNVSPVQLREPDFLAQLRGLLEETGMPPGALVVEVTESGVVDQVQTLVEARELGLGVAMDDFGTGYSSLSSLRRLPINGLKIDRTFVEAIAGDPVQYALVEGIVRMAGDLGLATVAEGVENEAQHDRLRATGCRYGQGFLYSRPLSGHEVEQWLSCARPA